MCICTWQFIEGRVLAGCSFFKCTEKCKHCGWWNHDSKTSCPCVLLGSSSIFTMWHHFVCCLTSCYLWFQYRSVSTGRLSEQPIRITLGGQAYQGSTDSLNTERPMDTGMSTVLHRHWTVCALVQLVTIWTYDYLYSSIVKVLYKHGIRVILSLHTVFLYS